MKTKEVFLELIKKIELQSIIVLFGMIIAGITLFLIKDPFPSPTSVLGISLIGFGIIYSFASFFTNNLRESYKDIIIEYKALNTELTKNYRAISDSYNKQITSIQGSTNQGAISTSPYKQLADEQASTPTNEGRNA